MSLMLFGSKSGNSRKGCEGAKRGNGSEGGEEGGEGARRGRGGGEEEEGKTICYLSCNHKIIINILLGSSIL